MRIKVSTGNRKLPRIANISLPPGAACGDVPCADSCYALKAYRMYPTTRAAWDNNAACYAADPVAYFHQIIDYVQLRAPRLFRWHVAGEIPDQFYLDGIYDVARECRGTRFLVFTKRHSLIGNRGPLEFYPRPANLSVVASMWPGWGDPRGGNTHTSTIPRAWTQDGTETRVPGDAVECFGRCDQCGVCWSLGKLGVDVVFHKH